MLFRKKHFKNKAYAVKNKVEYLRDIRLKIGYKID